MLTQEEFETFKANYRLTFNYPESKEKSERLDKITIEELYQNIKKCPHTMIEIESQYDDYDAHCLICYHDCGARSIYNVYDYANNHFLKSHSNLPLPFPERHQEMEEFRKEQQLQKQKDEALVFEKFIQSEN